MPKRDFHSFFNALSEEEKVRCFEELVTRLKPHAIGPAIVAVLPEPVLDDIAFALKQAALPLSSKGGDAMKDLYIAEYDRIRETLIEAGCPEDLADEIASERAYPAMRERFADMADTFRQREKDSR